MLALLAVAAAPAERVAPPLVIYAAGSTVGALGAMLQRYAAKTGQAVRMVNGPAGLLRERIEKGEPADLFVSANMAHPERLAREGKARGVVRFARNALCVTARPDVHLTSADMLDRMLDPKLAIGTSTPGADPGGDYAQALFEKAGTVRTGAAATLRAKAKALVGSGTPPAVPPGKDAARYFLDTHVVDMFVGYCSSHGLKAAPDGVDKVPVPSSLAVPVDYGMAVVTTSQDARRQAAAERLSVFLRRPDQQAALTAYGFIPARRNPFRRPSTACRSRACRGS